MDTRVRELLDLSFHRCPGVEANAEIARIRSLYELQFGRAFGYEVVVREEEPALDPDLLGRFAHHLRAKRVRADSCSEVFVAIFCDETLYFLRAHDFMNHLLGAEGLTVRDLPTCIERWQQAGEGRPRLLALPDPNDDADA
jgi:hypothetical protein